MSDVPESSSSREDRTERKKEQSLGFLAVSALGTVLAALVLFLSGGDPGWLVPISFVGGVFILAGASNFAFLSLSGRAQTVFLCGLGLVVAYILFGMGPGPHVAG